MVRLTVTGANTTAAVRSLEAWLVDHDEFRGRVQPVVVAPQPGTMGWMAEVLMVAVAPGGAATVLASALVAWIRRQVGQVSVNVARTDGTEITVRADHVRGLTTEKLRSVAAQLAAMLDGAGDGQ